VRDYGLRHHWQKHCAETGSYHDEGKRRPKAAIKPRGDGSGVGKMRGSVSHRAQDKTRQIELPYTKAQQRQRENGAHVYRHAGQNDSARTQAVDPSSQHRGYKT
jgi:hypothetical protein